MKNVRQITSSTKLTGIIGHPIAHTLSPEMHNRAFSLLGLDYVYVVFSIAPGDLSKVVPALPALAVKGINVTIPYKQEILKYLHEVSPLARRIGAVNTILIENDQLHGFNTDGDGFIVSLAEAGFNSRGKKVLLLGAGGACRAAALALAWSGAEIITIAARDIRKAESLVKETKLDEEAKTKCFVLRNLPTNEIAEADLIVNTTPLGMAPLERQMPLISCDMLHERQYVSDIIYNPLETLFLKKAKLKGCRTINGVGMLVHQGAKAFSLWTKEKAPVEEMRRIVLESVDKGRKKIP